ncbi:Calx-beta domain-containing protein [Sinimarinibacterium sp. NLF-5-8]|uniref:Calx-beta domain-containing protein n=1 Tax=Sinimarinibacterium sp. NLF-5-8 TaxID=2698684 RepID=UPI001EE4E566|nr:Calx-beta domain-containing protein [Sinimarinibacterium sp. NLF-5-8]
MLIAERLDSAAQPVGEQVQAPLHARGAYAIGIPWTGLTRLSVQGQFINEYTGALAEEGVRLSALADVRGAQTLNLNLFTHLLATRAEYLLLTEPVAWDAAAAQAQRDLQVLFDLDDATASERLNLLDVEQGGARDTAILLLVSYRLLKALDQAEVAPIITAKAGAQVHAKQLLLPGGVGNSLDGFARDFADNGLIDGGAELLHQQLAFPIDPTADLNAAASRLGQHIPNFQIDVPGIISPPPVWLGLLKVSVNDTLAYPGQTMQVEVTLSAAAPQPVSVRLRTEDGTARNGLHYVAVDRMVTFAKGEIQKIVPIATRHWPEGGARDPVRTRDRLWFSVVLQEPQGAVLGRERANLSLSYDTNIAITDVPNDFQIDEWVLEGFRVAGESVPVNSAVGFERDDVLIAQMRLSTSVACGMGTPPGQSRPVRRCEKPDGFIANVFVRGVDSRTELKLGSVWVPSSSIGGRLAIPPQADGLTHRFTLPLNTPALFDFARDRLEAGENTHFLVRLQVQRPNGGQPQAGLRSPMLLPLVGGLQIGDVQLQQLQFQSVVRDSTCVNGGALRVTATGNWLPAPEDWSAARMQLTGVCVALPSTRDQPLRVVSGYATPEQGDHVSGSVAGVAVTLVSAILTPQGLEVPLVRVSLPADISAHAAYSDVQDPPLARGTDFIDLLPDVNSLDARDVRRLIARHTRGTLPEIYLHAEGLPFYLLADEIRLQDGKLGAFRGALVGVAEPLPFANRDPRRNVTKQHALISNGGRYARGAFTDLWLNDTGLQASLSFSEGDATAHYPRAQMHWGGSATVALRDSQLQGSAVFASDESLRMQVSADCGSCGSEGARTPYVVHAQSRSMIDSDAAVMYRAQTVATPAWGPYDPGQQRRIFTRSDDASLDGTVYVPGVIARGSAQKGSVIAYLMGAREALAQADNMLAPRAVHLMGSPEERHGNHQFAGFTMGPALLVDALARPSLRHGSDLSGRGMTIGFGGLPNPQYRTLSANIGSKYVVRSGGLTGVFNFDDGSGAVPAYGYDLSLRRFAFRTVNNTLDPYNWMDGRIALPGDAGFDIHFSSLQLACNGALGQGHVDHEDAPGAPLCIDGQDNNGNGVVDENCNTVLAAWSARSDLLGVSFATPSSGPEQACTTGSRQLEVAHRLDVRAFSQPVGAVVRWAPDGSLMQAHLSSPSGQRLDPPQGVANRDQAGFAVTFNQLGMGQSRVNGQSQGWFTFDALAGVPFWDAVRGEGRAYNAQVDRLGQTALMSALPANHATLDHRELAQLGARDSGLGLTARYTWGSTGFGFSLPAFWEMERAVQGEVPRFLGRPLSVDLAVLDARSNVDFIDPLRTQISFGASADFERLSELAVRLKVDLGDPDSLEAIDDMLALIGVSGRPIGMGLGALRARMEMLNQLQATGLERAMESVVRGALNQLNEASGYPYRQATAQLAQIQTSLTGLVDDYAADLLTLTRDLTSPLTEAADRRVLTLYQQVPDALAQRLQALAQYTPGQALPPLDPAFVEARALVSDMSAQLSRVTPVFDQIEQRLQQAVQRIEALDDPSAPAVAALTAVQAQLQTLKAQSAQCSIQATPKQRVRAKAGGLSELPDPARETVHILLRPVVEAMARAEFANEALRVLNLMTLLAEPLAQAVNLDTSAIEQAQRDIQALAMDIDRRLLQVREQIEGELCTRARDLSTALDPAITEVNHLLERVRAVATIIDDIKQRTVQLAVPVRDSLTELRSQIDAVQTQISWLDQQLDRAEAALDADGDGRIDIDFTAAQAALPSADDIRAMIDAAFVNTVGVPLVDDTGASVLARLHKQLEQELAQAIAAARDTLDGHIARVMNSLPIYSERELMALAVRAIMDSAVAQTVLADANRALSSVTDQINRLADSAMDQINQAVRQAAQAAEDKANELLATATAPVKNLPLSAAGIDGYARIAGDDLERLHLAARWTMAGDGDQSGSSFNAALDLTSWSSNGKAANCGIGNAMSMLDATISTANLPIRIADSEVLIRKLMIGFTLDGVAPIGVNGGVFTSGSLDFEAFTLYDMGLALGVGREESYLGATAGATFDSVNLEAAFLVGRTCNLDVLTDLDPKVGDFIQVPGGRFSGAYVRGAAGIPVLTAGCPLNVNVAAEMGFWALAGPPSTVGGVIGGGAYGRVACLAALRGQVTAYAQKSGNTLIFRGEGFGAGGVGSCEPETWTSRARSRRDSWCGTGDAGFSVEYNQGWNVLDFGVSAVH